MGGAHEGKVSHVKRRRLDPVERPVRPVDTLVRMAAAVRGTNQMRVAIRDRSRRDRTNRIRRGERAGAIAARVQYPFNAASVASLGHCVWFTPCVQAYFTADRFHVTFFCSVLYAAPTPSTHLLRS